MIAFSGRHLNIEMPNKLKIAFVNPPHADWSLANNMTYMMVQSHYNLVGRYKASVEWIPAPYKFNKYESVEEIYEEISGANIVMFSSYAWNYSIIDTLASFIKRNHPDVITVIGGPHIGTNEPEFLEQRKPLYDFICKPTKPGEPFMEDLINSYFENDGKPKIEDISWEMRNLQTKNHNINTDISVYEEHFDYLKETLDYAKENKMEPFMIIETTRGCPYKCVYCEWGGGTGTKIIKKDLELVKRDIMALKKAGYRDAYLTDANFGAFEDRDIEIFRFAWHNNFNLTDISTMKSKSLERRKRLIDRWFEIVGRGPETHSKAEGGTDMWGETEFVSVVPTVSIQSISDEAMRISKRVDLSMEDKLELSRHIEKRCREEGFPVPALELILGMPGSTLEDFYNEVEVIWNFKAWSSFRHDYMFLPDSELNNVDYKKQHDIKTVEVFSDIVDEDGIDNWKTLYKNKKTYFRTMLSCYSYSEDDMKEMWFMNNAANYLLQNFYAGIQEYCKPQEFAKECFNVISKLEDYKPLKEEIDDIFNADTPPRSIRKLGGKFRVETIEEMLQKNMPIIKSEVMSRMLNK
jgi:tRNA A37 methylthiotransferase MiaB